MFPIQDNVQTRGVPLATYGIIFVNALIFLGELALPEERLERVLAVFGMVPARLAADPEAALTLFTCMFLHGGWTHIIGNMWTLYIFGDSVEDRLGSGPYLFFY